MLKRKTKKQLVHLLEARRRQRKEQFAEVSARACGRIISFGGGVQTTALLLRNPGAYSHVIFADVGAEGESTYAHIDKYVKPFCEEKGIKFVTVRHPERTLEEDMEARQVLPMITNRWCTTQFKIAPIKRYIRNVLGATAKRPVIMDMGFSADEATRIGNEMNVQYIYKNYPLVFADINRAGCERIIKEYGWPATPKSACDFCMFRGTRHFKRLAREQPERYERLIALEENAMKRKPYTLIKGISLRKLRDSHATGLEAYDVEGTCTSGVCGY